LAGGSACFQIQTGETLAHLVDCGNYIMEAAVEEEIP
jgi:hypothetical protein